KYRKKNTIETKMLQAREEYSVFAWKNRQDAFAWQSVSTKMIFWVVIVVVLTGLYLSWMQFKLAQKMPLTKTTQTKKGQSNKANPSGQIEASILPFDLTPLRMFIRKLLHWYLTHSEFR